MKNLALETGQNRLLILSEPIGRVSVADPKIADLKVITPTQMLLTSRGVGTTDLTLWNKLDQPLVLALQVSRNLNALRAQLLEFFPNEKITVSAAGDLVVISGEVADVRVPERAAEVAQLARREDRQPDSRRGQPAGPAGGEVRRGVAHRAARAGPQLLPSGRRRTVRGRHDQPVDLHRPVRSRCPGTGGAGGRRFQGRAVGGGFSLFFSGLPHFPFSAILTALESSGLAKMLAEPTLVALSGQEAKFLVGGEFPIPMSTGLGAVSVQWKKFGIILNFTPTVIADGALHLKLMTEVSDVDPARTVTVGGFSIPGLTSRQSETTVRLTDGQSFAIAGLLSDRVRSQIQRIPFLGDLPILGALFRSVTYQRDESELLVVVTAHLARPVSPHDAPHLPTENELNDPNDIQLFLFGSEGGGGPAKRTDDKKEAHLDGAGLAITAAARP